jgi:pimeloyl-ACP methyl ester carboxylesterase
LIFDLENKSVHASNAGQELDHKKETIIFLHGSGLSHIVWSLVEQFFQIKILMFYQLIYRVMVIQKVLVFILLKRLLIG